MLWQVMQIVSFEMSTYFLENNKKKYGQFIICYQVDIAGNV